MSSLEPSSSKPEQPPGLRRRSPGRGTREKPLPPARMQRGSLEVFGGAPASNRYHEGGSANPSADDHGGIDEESASPWGDNRPAMPPEAPNSQKLASKDSPIVVTPGKDPPLVPLSGTEKKETEGVYAGGSQGAGWLESKEVAENNSSLDGESKRKVVKHARSSSDSKVRSPLESVISSESLKHEVSFITSISHYTFYASTFHGNILVGVWVPAKLGELS